MVTEQEVLAALEGVVDPELGGKVVELGMIARVTLADGKVLPNAPPGD